ncbi:hypothetical protein B0H21DRAFT_120247 [Amylocystis lapponica]|nr:hypothetical protein B0H21DRAFT_120247 [Amylocystis lapponica]
MSDPPAPDIPAIGLLDLPNELLLRVQEFIPDEDLRTHVCFHHTCPRVASLYGDTDEQELFWQKTCRLAALGLIEDEKEDSVSWTAIAFDCIARDGFCKHPQCGGGLLERNAREMEKEPSLDDEGMEISECHYLFSWLEFCKHRTGMEDGFLRPNSKDVTLAIVPSLLLRNHPIASRSFATFPTMGAMVICTIAGHDTPEVVRPSGVTVWDVQANIQSVLDIQLHVSDLNAYMLPMVKNLTSRGWDILTVFGMMETLRSAFKMIRWSGLQWDEEAIKDNFFEVLLEAEDRDFGRE